MKYKRRYNFDEVREKLSIPFTPSDGESLEGYAIRAGSIISQYREHLSNHVGWFTHYGAGPCPVCDLLALCDYLQGIFLDISKYDKKKVWAASKPTSDPLSWVFTPRSRPN